MKLKVIVISNEKDDVEDSFENMLTFIVKSGLPEDVTLAEVKTMLLAGYETTSSTIHYLLFMLALDQNHQNACREEILRAFHDPLKCPDGQLTMEVLSELRYLERFIQETLRLFPVLFTIARKLETPLVIDEDLEIPSGSNVAVRILQLHRSPEYFPNPDEFQPERILPENRIRGSFVCLCAIFKRTSFLHWNEICSPGSKNRSSTCSEGV